jgi:hypothetical protein
MTNSQVELLVTESHGKARSMPLLTGQYKYENGSLSHILHQSRIYYFMKTDDVQPFPPGLRMISGNPSNRNASDPRAMGVRFNCNHDKQTQELPTQTPGRGPCSGIGAGIFFPSCGLADGSLDSENHL